MSDRPDQHIGREAKRGHLKLIETPNVEDVEFDPETTSS